MDSNLSQQLFSILRQIAREEFILLINEQTETGISIPQIQYPQIPTQTIITSKIGWLKGNNSLLRLYETILTHGFIACDFETFRAHFIGTEITTEFIAWHSDITQLVYLFNQLKEEGFIPKHKNPHKLLEEHFLNRQGNHLNSRSLRSSLNNVRNNKPIKIIENIIQALHVSKN